MWGRTRRVPRILSPVPKIRGRSERKSIGSLIQGTAAELTKESLVRLDRWRREEGLGFRMKLTVHDEIQLDTPMEELVRAATGSKWVMEQYPEFAPIPIVADVEYSVTNWAEKKKCPV
jgi:DNA polymerase-1